VLDESGLGTPPGVDFHRLRVDHWRVIYAINEAEGWVWVLAIRSRPPYDYSDLKELLRKVK